MPHPGPSQAAGPTLSRGLLRQPGVSSEKNKQKVLDDLKIEELKTRASQYLIAAEKANMAIAKQQISVTVLNDENGRLNRCLEKLRDRLNNNGPPSPVKNTAPKIQKAATPKTQKNDEKKKNEKQTPLTLGLELVTSIAFDGTYAHGSPRAPAWPTSQAGTGGQLAVKYRTHRSRTIANRALRSSPEPP